MSSDLFRRTRPRRIFRSVTTSVGQLDVETVVKRNSPPCGMGSTTSQAKLIDSPPGHLGHRETHPMITQEALAASHTDKVVG